MIINRIWSENVLKYAELDLNHLPSDGLIAVSGPNEAGKSTIGEIICFALFGRTFSIEPDEIVKAIHWDEPRCAASIEFTIDGKSYAISRFLDDNGTQGARLSVLGQDPFARGVDAVREALAELIGFGYEEFIQSFYLAQREITTPHPHSTAVKRMAGIAALEAVTTVADIEIEHEQQSIADTETLIADVEQVVTDLAFDATQLPDLEGQHHRQTSQQDQAKQQIFAWEQTQAAHADSAVTLTSAAASMAAVNLEMSFQDWQTSLSHFDDTLTDITQKQSDPKLAPGELQLFVQATKTHLDTFEQIKTHSRPYRDHLGYLLGETPKQPLHAQDIKPLADRQASLVRDLDKAQHSRKLARAGFVILLIVALIGWAGFSLVSLMPDTVAAGWLITGLRPILGNWHLYTNLLLAAAAVTSTIGCLLYRGRSHKLQTTLPQIRQSADHLELETRITRREATALDTLSATPLPQALNALTRMRDANLGRQAAEFQTGLGAAFSESDGLEVFKGRVSNLVSAHTTRLNDEGHRIARTIANTQAEIAQRQTGLSLLKKAITEERERRRKHDELNAIITGHLAQIERHKRRIETRQLACELVEGGCHHIAKTFNRDVRGLVSRTLPLLTEGRYEHLKIDENLYVQVFSSEKRDFMHLEEISSGTQRQIMLAVRLALSQEFISTTLERHQFIFLDEPFAFFDQERTRAALHALPQLSHELRQLWIVAQEFPPNFPFDRHIHCTKEIHQLSSTA